MTLEISENSRFSEFEDSATLEENRIKSLLEYNIDLTSPEKELDEITKLLSIICKTPIACVTLLDSSKIWFKSTNGLDCVCCDQTASFCKQVIKQKNVFEVCDSNQDERFKAHPMVIGSPGIRYYAGIPLVTPCGYNIGVLCVIDIQPRKLKDNQRIALATLAQHVMMFFELKKRNNDLKIANEKANKLAKTKEEFLSNISHEIRTPLNAIYGFTELLSRTNINKNQTEMLNIVRSSVEILMAIINDILDFSKIESGKLKIENHPFNLEKSITSIKELFSHKAREKNLVLNFYIDKKLPKIINGDKIRINQIITNLVGNAIKFTNKGFIELTVKLEEDSADKILINFSVKDSGIGIPREKLETIFERFQQADNDITRKYGGTGLGLSISRSLVEMQGGVLSIESELGKGSVFTFTLSLEKVNELRIQKVLNTEKRGKKYKIEEEKRSFNDELKKITKKDKLEVLILEDTIFNYILIDKIFDNTIIKLDYAENGEIGLQKFENKNYDLILLDLQMPEMDGFEFAKIVRNVKRSEILMLAMTANNSGFEKQKCFEIGINDYFTKPFKRKSLLDGILRNLSNKAANSANNTSANQGCNLDNNVSNLSIISLQGSCNSNNNSSNVNNNANLNLNLNNFIGNENFDGSVNLYFDDYVLKNDFNFTICSNNKSLNNDSRCEFAEGKERPKGRRSKKRRKTGNTAKVGFKKSDEEEQGNLYAPIKNASDKNVLNENIKNKIHFLSDFPSAQENFSDESLKESDQSQEDLEILRIIRKGNSIKFCVNEEEYQSDLNVLDKNNNFKNSNLKISSSFLDTETEPEIIINPQLNANLYKKRIESNSSNNYNISGFSTQDESTKEKKTNFSDCSIKDSFNNNISKKCSLFQTQSMKIRHTDNELDLIENKDLFDLSEQEKNEFEDVNLNINNNFICNITANSKQDCLKKNNVLTEKDSVSVSEQSSYFDVNILGKNNFEKSENDLIAKSRFKKLKSKFSIAEFEKDYYSNNHSVNSIIRDTREVKSECFTSKKRYYHHAKTLNKSKFKKRNYKNDNIDLLDDIEDSCDGKVNHCNISKVYTKKGFSSSDEQEKYVFSSALANKNLANKSKNLNENSDNNEFDSESCVERSCNFKNDLVIDFSYLEEISAGDFDFQRELALIFLTETPIQISNLKAACEKFNFKDIHLITHSLKTSFNMLGVVNIKEKFQAIENLVKKIKDAKDSPDDEFYFTNEEIDEIKLKIKSFSNWLNNEYSSVFKVMEEKVSGKYAKKINE